MANERLDPCSTSKVVDECAVPVPPSRQASDLDDRWLAALLERSNDLLFALDAHGTLRYETPAIERVLGVPRAEPGADAFERIHPDDLSRVTKAYAGMLAQPGKSEQLEFRMRRRDGSYAHVEGVATNLLDDPVVKSIVMNVRDTTGHRLVDPVSGLASRLLLSQRVEQLRAQGGTTFALIAVRAERIARIAATLSSREQLSLLAAVVARINSVVSPDDVVGRLDKHTIGILAQGVCDLDTAMPVIERVRQAFRAPFDVGSGSVELEGMFGLAIDPRPDVSGEDLVRYAEMALESGSGVGVGVKVFRPSVLLRARSRLSVEAELRQALRTDELVAYYQPIIRIDTGRIEGFEALVRWRKPDGRVIPPLSFIPIAEESGLIRKLDYLVLRQACEFARRLQDRVPGSAPFVNVNLSTLHFSDAALPDVVTGILAETSLPGSLLKLEVTETALMDNTDFAVGMMTSLRERGVRFSLDDFGTGYSSLSYLHRFPFETLKIDRSFIRTLGSQEGRPELATAIIALARSLGLVAVAEGVETNAQLDFLRPRQCDFAQGFLYSPAVLEDDAEALFAGQPFVATPMVDRSDR